MLAQVDDLLDYLRLSDRRAVQWRILLPSGTRTVNTLSQFET